MQAVSIGEVERETGLSKDTLRVWERRYGFPTPSRNEHDERIYSDEQVQRLRVIRRLLDSGLRPGKIVGLSAADLANVGSSPRKGKAALDERKDSIELAMQMILGHRAEELRSHLVQRLMQLGLRQFILEVVVPLNERVGDAWLQGSIEIFEEHLYTNQIQALLQHALGGLPTPAMEPRVLLTTLPGEEHQLGLLMAHAFFAMEGAQCFSLGTQTPIADILKAVDAHRVGVVGLSCSTNAARGTQSQLAALRERLGREVELWVGGSAAALYPSQDDAIRRVRFAARHIERCRNVARNP